MKKIVPILICMTAMLASCRTLPIPDNWKVENEAFLAKVKEANAKIDPQHNWVATTSYSIKGFSVSPYDDSELSSANVAAYPSTKASDQVKHKADFFRVLWGPKTGRELVVRIETQGSNITEYGLYYYNMADQRIEKPVSATGSSKIDFDGVSDSDCFGVYIVKNGIKIYSESRYNEGLMQCCEYIAQAEDKSKTSNRAYIYLSDAVFKINSNDDIVGLDYDRGPWMLLCEDIGSERSDNDFNDVVFVVHRPDAFHIFVEFSATGATLHDIVFYKDHSFGEIHDILGVAIPNMVNVIVDDTPHVISSTMEVPKEFTMTNGDFGGFFVTCNGIPNADGKIEDRGYAPYLLVVPAYMKWCRELISIFDAFPEFMGWVQDHTTNVDWFMHPISEKVVHKAE